MHQSHNIPWHILSEHVKFKHHQVPVNTRTGHRSRVGYVHGNIGNYTLETRGKSGQAKALNHFVRKLVGTVEEFSRTERAKFPIDLTTELFHPDTGPLVFESQWERLTSNPTLRFHLSDTDKFKHIEDWIVGFEAPHGLQEVCASFVKGLIAADEIKALLMLISHPRLNRDEEVEIHNTSTNPAQWKRSTVHINALDRISRIGQAYVYGWVDLGEISLELYILLNLIAAMKAEHQPKYGFHWYRKVDRYRQLCFNMECYQNRMQYIRFNTAATEEEQEQTPLTRQERLNPHEIFLLSSTEFYMHKPSPYISGSNPNTSPHPDAAEMNQNEDFTTRYDLFDDPQALHGYLSKLFRFIYITDLAARECGGKVEWKEHATYFLSNLVTGLQTQTKFTETGHTTEFK